MTCLLDTVNRKGRNIHADWQMEGKLREGELTFKRDLQIGL